MDIELAQLGDRRNQSHVGSNLVAASETPAIVDGGGTGTGHDRPDTRNGHQPSRHFGLDGLPDELLSLRSIDWSACLETATGGSILWARERPRIRALCAKAV